MQTPSKSHQHARIPHARKQRERCGDICLMVCWTTACSGLPCAFVTRWGILHLSYSRVNDDSVFTPVMDYDANQRCAPHQKKSGLGRSIPLESAIRYECPSDSAGLCISSKSNKKTTKSITRAVILCDVPSSLEYDNYDAWGFFRGEIPHLRLRQGRAAKLRSVATCFPLPGPQGKLALAG